MDVDRLKELWEASSDKYAEAKKMGTTYQTMYNIIYKQRPFRTDLLERIAQYYQVPVGYFFDETDEAGQPENQKRIIYLEGQVQALMDALKALKTR